MDERKVCTVCRTTGKAGALWVAKVGNDQMPVHKDCGQRLTETAPTGTVVEVFPSKELRHAWQQQKREREVQNFWQQKFAQARAT